MSVKYLKKSPKTSSTDDSKTREIVENILKDIISIIIWVGLLKIGQVDIIFLKMCVIKPQIKIILII